MIKKDEKPKNKIKIVRENTSYVLSNGDLSISVTVKEDENRILIYNEDFSCGEFKIKGSPKRIKKLSKLMFLASSLKQDTGEKK